MDLNDKAAWCEAFGEAAELRLVASLFRSGLSVSMSPRKAADKYGHDLLLTVPADLKTIRTPLFKARELYGMDPQFVVPINEKDVARYASLYPGMIVLYDVAWEPPEKEIGGVLYRVNPMSGIWLAPLHLIRRAIASGRAPPIDYRGRVNDDRGNAKRSFCLDLRWFEKIPAQMTTPPAMEEAPARAPIEEEQSAARCRGSV